MAVNHGRAGRSNRVYALQLRWLERFSQIVQVLGFTNRSPGENQFADAVAAWQRQTNLSDDGILGPRTWGVMEPLTRFSIGQRQLPEWIAVARSELEGVEREINRLGQQLRDSRQADRSVPPRPRPAAATTMRTTDTLIELAARDRRRLFRAWGRMHATLLYLSKEYPNEQSSERLKELRDAGIGVQRLRDALFLPGGGPVLERVDLAFVAVFDGMIAFAEAREERLIARAGGGWTSVIPRMAEMHQISQEPGSEAFDEGYEDQRNELHSNPFGAVSTQILLIFVEVLLWEVGGPVVGRASVVAAMVRAGRLGALTIRNAYRQILQRLVLRRIGGGATLRSVAQGLVQQLRRSGRRVIVNLGGEASLRDIARWGDAARDAINLNPLTVARPQQGIPNLVRAPGEQIGELFDPNQVDEIISTRLPFDTIAWERVIPNAHRVLKPGGRITINFQGVGSDAATILREMAGARFQRVENVGNVGAVLIGVK